MGRRAKLTDRAPAGAKNAHRMVAPMVAAACAGLIALGVFVHFDASTPFALSLFWEDMVLGVAATAPLAVLLFGFTSVKTGPVAHFRVRQIAFFAQMGLAFTWPLIVAMSVTAGIWEEIIFRGFAQNLFATAMPLPYAIILVNIVFGVLHWQSAVYALIAGCVGLYLSALYLVTGNLLAPIVTHTLYDILAFFFLKRALATSH